MHTAVPPPRVLAGRASTRVRVGLAIHDSDFTSETQDADQRPARRPTPPSGIYP